MKHEEKQLLLQDICARLPYGVKVQIDLQSDTYPPITCKVVYVECTDPKSVFVGVETSPDTYNEFREFLCKPYLFPLSSMTEEQQIDLTKYLNARVFVNGEISFQCLYANTMDRWKRVFEWCIKNHFDIYGLIPMGLAIDCTNLNIY